jgi:hypothetical protein
MNLFMPDSVPPPINHRRTYGDELANFATSSICALMRREVVPERELDLPLRAQADVLENVISGPSTTDEQLAKI